jgi:hypothetical protein
MTERSIAPLVSSTESVDAALLLDPVGARIREDREMVDGRHSSRDGG